MKDNLKDILSNLNPEVDQEKLLQYLNNQLTEKERHEVERQINDDPFMNDALEGLSELNPPSSIRPAVQQMNLRLAQQLKNKKRRPTIFEGQSWIYIAVIIILLLAVLGYLVLRALK